MPPGPGAVILLSGGLDSTVSLALSLDEYTPKLALFFDYGQKALAREEDAAAAITDFYHIEMKKVALPWLSGISSSAIIKSDKEIPEYSGAGAKQRLDASRAVWVENRNGIFINISAAFAAASGCAVIVTGFNLEEASTFPDNSASYIEAANRALELGAGADVRVIAPTVSMEKREIAAMGITLDIPWEFLWSCYNADETMCGTCESCVRLRKAIEGTSAAERVRFSREN